MLWEIYLCRQTFFLSCILGSFLSGCIFYRIRQDSWLQWQAPSLVKQKRNVLEAYPPPSLRNWQKAEPSTEKQQDLGVGQPMYSPGPPKARLTRTLQCPLLLASAPSFLTPQTSRRISVLLELLSLRTPLLSPNLRWEWAGRSPAYFSVSRDWSFPLASGRGVSALSLQTVGVLDPRWEKGKITSTNTSFAYYMWGDGVHR